MERIKMTRREFMRTVGISCAVGGPLIGSIGSGAWAMRTRHAASDGHPGMEYRTLGRTGLKVSAVSFGVMRLTDPAVLIHALDSGVNYFDTAHGYQNGNNEKMLGEVLQDYGREKVLIGTKVPPYQRRGSGAVLRSAAEMEEMVEESLARLKTDHVDVLFLHNIKDAGWPVQEEMMKFLQRQKDSGKARSVGISFHVEGSLYVDIVDQALKTEFYDVFLATLNFKSPPEHIQALRKAHGQGVGVVAMKTQAGGYVAGEGLGDNPHQAALRWALDKDFVDCAIPGMVNRDQVAENLAVVGQKTGRKDRRTLHAYYASISDRYCVHCGACVGTCARNVQIPTIHRCLMYWEGYADPELAKSAYGELLPGENGWSCMDCTSPTCSCANGIAIPERMRRAHRAFA